MVTLFLGGDVMIGRGIDQVLERSVDPWLPERSTSSAETYVALAVRANGSFPRPVAPDYVWGTAVEAIGAFTPAVRIVNLETALTTSAAAWPGKDVCYRSHPANVAVLGAGAIDCCNLANNHVLDWGSPGLVETLDTLHDARIATTGAGRDLADANEPAILDVPGGRVIVVGLASTSSGVPARWAAGRDWPGVAFLDERAADAADAVQARLDAIRRPRDIVVVSLHWGSNWGDDVPAAQRRLAHRLIDGGVDIVHGHSSHHPRPIERYRNRLILYGCGDLITDYEGIAGYEAYRNDLVLGYVASLDSETGETVALTMVPFKLRQFQLAKVTNADVAWLAARMDRTCRPFGVRVELGAEGNLSAA